jgi:DNA (cytosine-5)-methyltransferase 1
MAGFREVFASEWDAHACQVFRRNFPTVPLLEGDVTDLTVERALEVAQLEPGQLDVWDGSPPCQGFSTLGLRDLADPRSRLFEQYVRLLEGLQPRALVMENVSGMVKGKMRATFVEVLKALQGAGYRVGAAVLDARYFGAPTKRQRVIFVGFRQDLGLEPSWPAGDSTVRTVWDAIAGLPDPGLFLAPTGKGLEVALRTRQGEDGGSALARHGLKASYFQTQRPAWSEPAPTIIKTCRPAQASGMLHPELTRFMGVRELSRLQSFPDGFEWSGEGEPVDYIEVHARIGNSVPPLLMRAVAAHVRQKLDQLG